MQEKLQSIIEKSSLTESQKRLWLNFIQITPDPESLKDILDAFESDPKNLELLTDNLEKKAKALSDPDDKKWKVVVEEEKKILG